MAQKILIEGPASDLPAYESRKGRLKDNRFSSKVIVPNYLAYDDTASTPTNPYSIFLAGELKGPALSGQKYVDIDIAVAVLVEEHESIYFGPGEPPRFWMEAPDGLLVWDGTRRHNWRVAERYQYSVAGHDYAIVGRALNPVTINSSVSFAAPNDLMLIGGTKWRRVANLRCQYLTHDFDFSAEVRLRLDNTLAREYAQGRMVDLVFHKILAIRILAIFKFVAKTTTTHAFVLGDGQPESDRSELQLAPGTIAITEQSIPTLAPQAYIRDEETGSYSAAQDLVVNGSVPVYKLYYQYVRDNEYGYIANLETTAFLDHAGHMHAGGGPYVVRFSSLFKLSNESDTVDDLMGDSSPVWQTIEFADFTIYLEDQNGNRVNLDAGNKMVDIGTRSNAFKGPTETERVTSKFIKALASTLFGRIEKLGDVIDAVELIASLQPVPEMDLKKLCVMEKYDENANQALVDFSWGFIDGSEQYQPVRQDLAFELMFTFYTPPAPGQYDLVLKQNVYVNPSHFCEAPPNDKEYQYSIRESPGGYWMRSFETRYPVKLVTHFVANSNTGEIHDTRNLNSACRFYMISPAHMVYLNSIEDVQRAIAEKGYNGCHFCMTQYDTG